MTTAKSCCAFTKEGFRAKDVHGNVYVVHTLYQPLNSTLTAQPISILSNILIFTKGNRKATEGYKVVGYLFRIEGNKPKQELISDGRFVKLPF